MNDELSRVEWTSEGRKDYVIQYFFLYILNVTNTVRLRSRDAENMLASDKL